jgi:hypothetical protein
MQLTSNFSSFSNILIASIFLTCSTKCTSPQNKQLFKLKEASSTGLHFSNKITISDSLNAVTFEYVYNGGGAAVGDVNNDGLKDLFFSGNMVSSRLYLNQGGLKFADITELSGTLTKSWCNGASFVDINQDGLLDLYVCVAGVVAPKLRKNIFYINQGIDEKGVPHFTNEALEMGLADEGYSTMAVFFDYDKDLDLDMYLLTNSMEGNQRNMLKPISVDGNSESTDRFYLNNGDGSFSNHSKQAGILIEGFGLGIAICDINQDNWLDVYCANDFISNDLLWINNQDGTFTEMAGKYFKHFTNNGMGMDVADYNNDGLLDIVELDMMPITNLRQKLMFAFRNMDRMHEAEEMGYLTQYMRNTLQLNMGKFPDGQYRFSEIGLLGGMYQTDWSWAPVLIDFDNDGWKDLLITNGYRKDVTNLDYINEIIRETKFKSDETKEAFLVNSIYKLKDVQLPNFIFRNNRHLTFEDKSKEWGLNVPTFSNGTVTADLDNDGDVDIVVNNIDQEAYLYENQLNLRKGVPTNHFINIVFEKNIAQSDRIGTKIWVFQQDKNQFFEYSPYRGYKSTVDQDIHIGLGINSSVDSLIIQWPDGKVQPVYHVKTDSEFILNKSESAFFYDGSYISQFNEKQSMIVFHDIADSLNLAFKHKESYTNDFRFTPTLMRSLSKNGPSLTVGDVNGDGLEDIIFGSDKEIPTVLLKQRTGGQFTKNEIVQDSIHEDVGSLLFDADNDGDLDLYIVSGGSLWKENDERYQDRLYYNDGAGNFEPAQKSLPNTTSSGSCVIAGDYDQDGDLDLFVGGRLVPRKYPSPPQSYLLKNEGGVFIDQSQILGKQNGQLGMVTSALWTDVNNDLKPDLIIVGEWMSITVLINKEGLFVDQSDIFNLENTSGWWNSINGGDFDNDGDIDYLAGNFGLNSLYKASVKEPLEIYGKDFDHNGVFDPIMTNYILGESYIVHPKNSMDQMIPSFSNRFLTYEDYGKTPFNKSFTEKEIEGSVHLKCVIMESVILENVEGKSFKIRKLPIELQFSPIFGSLMEDFNMDNRVDIMVVGNSMADENLAGYYDASFGSIMINQEDFNFDILPPSKSNFIADGDQKALVKMIIDDSPVYIVAENNGQSKAFTFDAPSLMRNQELDQDMWFYSLNHNGLNRKVELYHGSGFLSLSTRIISIPESTASFTLFDFSGKQK